VLTIDVKPVLSSEIHQSNTAADTPFALTLVSDSGIAPYQFGNLGMAAHGVLVGEGDTYTYIPQLDFVGTDNFSYEVTDSTGRSVVHTMQVIVNPRPAATIIVNTTLDEFPLAINGTCTLEEAIA